MKYDMLVDEEIPPDNVECLEKAEKRYINVMNYYYNYVYYEKNMSF